MSYATLDRFVELVLTTPQGWTFLAIGHLVGGVLSLLLFSVTVIAIPILLDRDIDFITAMITSVRAVLASPPRHARLGHRRHARGACRVRAILSRPGGGLAAARPRHVAPLSPGGSGGDVKAELRGATYPLSNDGATDMGIRTIMVQLDLDDPAEPRLRFGQELARRFDASLVAFAAAEADMIAPVGDNAIGAAEAMRLQVEDIESRLREIEAEVRRVGGGERQPSWLGLIDDPSASLGRHARAADLIVTGPASRKPSRSRGVVDPGAVILCAGRPVLVPAEDLAALRGEGVVVAWKDAREARRAVADAMPFLAMAGQVAVVTIEEDAVREAKQSAADVVASLARHGVKAKPVVVDAGASQADALEKVAAEIGADLVVAGAYGHSRLREWAFGGMTRSLLGKGKLHRLFSN